MALRHRETLFGIAIPASGSVPVAAGENTYQVTVTVTLAIEQ